MSRSVALVHPLPLCICIAAALLYQYKRNSFASLSFFLEFSCRLSLLMFWVHQQHHHVQWILYMPRDNPLRPRGEDADFVLSALQTFGAADMVGGWAGNGIDSGEYSRKLMSNTIFAIMKQKYPIYPRKALNKAFYKTNAKGISTACIVTLHGDKLRAGNVGDSGFVHIRGGKIMYKSPVQQHKFNVPYQLGKGSYDIRLAEEIKRDVEPGDVIVAGADGSFDNVHEEELEELVRKGQEDHGFPSLLAMTIAEFALGQSLSKSAMLLLQWKAKRLETLGALAARLMI